MIVEFCVQIVHMASGVHGAHVVLHVAKESKSEIAALRVTYEYKIVIFSVIPFYSSAGRSDLRLHKTNRDMHFDWLCCELWLFAVDTMEPMHNNLWTWQPV